MRGKLKVLRFGTALAVVLLSLLLLVSSAVFAIYVEFFLTPEEYIEFVTVDGSWLLFGMAALANVLIWITLVDVFRPRRRLGKTFLSGIPVMACVVMVNIAATTFYWSREIWKRST